MKNIYRYPLRIHITNIYVLQTVCVRFFNTLWSCTDDPNAKVYLQHELQVAGFDAASLVQVGSEIPLIIMPIVYLSVIFFFFNTMPPWKMDCHVFVLYIINLLWPVIVACLSSHSSTIYNFIFNYIYFILGWLLWL